MNDSTTAAAQVTMTGASALIVSLLGVEPQGLLYAVVGSTLGTSLAKPAGFFRGIAVFIAATLVCALLGTLIADQWWRGAPLARNVATTLLGMAFHPLFSAFIEAVPGLVQACKDFVIRRVFGGTQ
jgi:hypothetical protein